MAINYHYQPETPLLKLSNRDIWTLNDAYMGAVIIGATGSGKTSGSGRALALSYLSSGFGGLVLCAKPDESELWQSYAKQTGREKSLIIINGKNERCFNFLEYEMARIDAGSSANNAVSALMKVLEVMRNIDGGGGKEESFWKDSVRVLLSNTIDALYSAYGRVSLPEIMRFVSSTPRSAEQVQDKQWRDNSFCLKTLEKSAKNPEKPMVLEDFETVLHYFQGESFGSLDNKTRSNIIATLTSMVHDFLKGDLRRLLCTNTTTVPELSHEGAVIVLDLPLKTWERGGILAQQIFKFAWQRAIERRKVTATTRPCFLWADECQLFLSSYDAEFQSTARSSRVCSVSLTQSLPALYHAAGGNNPEHAVNAYLTNFQTKIIHTCQDHQTMHWAADLIGKSLQYRHGYSESTTTGTSRGVSRGGSSAYGGSSGGQVGQDSSNWNYGRNWGINSSTSESVTHGSSYQETIDYIIQPAFFASGLRTGGKQNGYFVDGVLFQGGKVWRHTNSPWLQCTFKQK